MANAYEQQARVIKAARLADALALNGVRSADAATYSEPAREALARAVGVRIPSAETWRLVVADLVLREAAVTYVPEPDPFDGL
jgi:hypothetical protein